jgi:hypothetical protein
MAQGGAVAVTMMKPHMEEASEMATIRASCEHCGDVELTTADVAVRVCAEDNQGSYSFQCPECGVIVVKPAEPRTVDLLVASGVSYATWSMPAELCEPRGLGAAAITHDELLDFHELLGDDLRLERAMDALLGT